MDGPDWALVGGWEGCEGSSGGRERKEAGSGEEGGGRKADRGMRRREGEGCGGWGGGGGREQAGWLWVAPPCRGPCVQAKSGRCAHLYTVYNWNTACFCATQN